MPVKSFKAKCQRKLPVGNRNVDPSELGTEIRELKIGSSFFDKQTAFHALRYDFKPASVLSGSQEATLEIGSNHQVTVTHVSSPGAPPTVFKGSRRPYRKECVLIIDKITGEVTIEKLESNIQLKKTRQQCNKKSNLNNLKNGVGKLLTNTAENHTEGNVFKETMSPQNGSKCLQPFPNKTPKATDSISSPQNDLATEESGSNKCTAGFDSGNQTAGEEMKDWTDTSNGQFDASESEQDVSESDSDSDSSDTDSESSVQLSTFHSTNNYNGKCSTITSNPFLNKDLQLSESGSDTE